MVCFLHADSRLTQDWLEELKSILRKMNLIYFFKFKINNKRLTFRFLEILVNLRCLFFKKPYGDQGLVINRRTYFKYKGYREIPLMEDLDFINRINDSKLRQLNYSICTSSRKWEKNNIIHQAIKNWRFRRRWLKGESINSIYNDYYKK